MEPTIRRIAPHDGALLADVRLRALADAPYAFETTYAEAAARPDTDWVESARRRSTGDGEATFFAQIDGAVVGMVGGYVPHDRATVDLVAMWVAPEARRRGVGQLLVQAVVDWATDAGACELRLCVVEGNDVARRLYESSGFVVNGEPIRSTAHPERTEHRMIRAL
jgi:GNAT superfamily N-acetyltransferase